MAKGDKSNAVKAAIKANPEATNEAIQAIVKKNDKMEVSIGLISNVRNRPEGGRKAKQKAAQTVNGDMLKAAQKFAGGDIDAARTNYAAAMSLSEVLDGIDAGEVFDLLKSLTAAVAPAVPVVPADKKKTAAA